jgi:hypothetical protein
LQFLLLSFDGGGGGDDDDEDFTNHRISETVKIVAPK